jgi:diguanylate cyclase (GGDEF)-like protein/PAS domain S-box-containing protein
MRRWVTDTTGMVNNVLQGAESDEPAAGFDPHRALTAAEREREDLLELLYLCPVGIVKLDSYGSIKLMNPYGTQMLMPLSVGGAIANLFDLFEPFAPEVGEMARRFPARTGKVCEEHRVVLPPRNAKARAAMFSVTLQKVDSDIYVAVLTDVTAAAERELFVRRSEERLHAVLDGVKDYSICTVDAAGVITSWNNAAERLDDYRSDETMGRHLDVLVPSTGSSKSPTMRRLEIALRDGSHDFEGWRIRKDGKRYWASTAIGVLHAKDGHTLIGYSVITQDLTEQKRAEDRLRLLAMTDPLTGALNRRSFFEHAKREQARMAAAEDPLTVLMLDADYFKRVNDAHGHDGGDATLQRIVADCRKEIRSTDVFARFGGEEFAILLPGSSLETGRLLAERIRERIAASGVEPGAFPCTVSIGVAASSGSDETVEEIINRADAALYAAKDAGRNCVVVSLREPNVALPVDVR